MSASVALLAGVTALVAGWWLGTRHPAPAGPAVADETTTSLPIRSLRPRGALVATPRPAAASATWFDRTAVMRLVTTAADGAERVRLLRVFDLRRDDGETRTIAFVDDPADVRGTAWLAFTHRDLAPDQWLYLPEIERIRRITTTLHTLAFLGTAFSFGDLTLLAALQNGDAVAATVVERGADVVDTTPVTVVELRSLAPELWEYGRLVVSFGTRDGIIRRVRFFDPGNEPVKELVQGDIRDVAGVPVAHAAEMRAARRRTSVELSDVTVNRGLAESLFTARAMARGAAR